jgi:prepilin-type N-terminal cleavage/methylation domain-containing protein
MKHCKSGRRSTRGFTLIELLVVISIIAILAGLLLPVISKAKIKAQVAKAQVEMKNLEAAISAYEADYNRFPSSKLARGSVNAANPDFTYGTVHRFFTGTSQPLVNRKGEVLPTIRNLPNRTPPYDASNAEVLAALLDKERWPNGDATWNSEHAMNPKKQTYLDVRQVSGVNQPGVGDDGVYRDPWANPYILTLDLDYDGRCRDAFYRLEMVSWAGSGDKGLNGMSRPPGAKDDFEAGRKIMVWSFGPDGVANAALKANVGVNKDNVLSW